jgi:hypothetical protein
MPKRDAIPDGLTGFILDYLVSKSPALISMAELARELTSHDEDPEMVRFQVDECIATLAGSGLVNRLTDYVFASRAAIRAHEVAT